MFAGIYVAVKTIFGEMPFEAAFLAAAGFLYSWHWAWTVILGLLIVLFSFGLIGLASLAGMARFGAGGAVAGALGGGTLTLFGLIFFFLRQGAYIFGSWLLAHAGASGMAVAEFSTSMLVTGAILYLIAVLFKRS